MIGNRDLRVADDRKIQRSQLSQKAREGSIRKIFQAYERIQDAAQIQVRVRFIDDAYVRQLLASASEFKLVFASMVRPSIWTEWIQRPFGFEKQVIVT